MQIRLTVVDPLGPAPQRGRAASRDVLVTAPTGTDLAAVASALAGAVTGEGRDAAGSSVVLYAGTDRLDPRRCTLGEPPLVDGAVLSLGAPAAPEPHPELDDAPTQLHVVAGPDAGGVHLLHGGRITVGRSADADVPLDDPDVSRLHCAVTVGADGRISVTDLGSTNGTALDGVRVDERPVRVPAGGLVRIGESALRVAPSGGPAARVRTVSDGEGCVRVVPGADASAGASACAGASGGTRPPAGSGFPPAPPVRLSSPGAGGPGGGEAPPAGAGGAGAGPVGAQHGYGSAGWGTSGSGGQEHRRGEPAVVPGQGGAPRIENAPGAASGGDTHAGRLGVGGTGAEPLDSGRKGTPVRGIDAPQGVRRRGLGAWARRLAGGRGEESTAPEPYDGTDTRVGTVPALPAPQQPETWPDPAALLLTALGPGPRLWERGPSHPETLTVRLGTADRSAPDGTGMVPAVPVTAALREAGALGLAGPRPRLSGLTRSVLAQLAALHSPDLLEIVLISADRSRPVEERTAEWSWLGWLPHVRPGHGQDCRLLLAYDREQAAARTEELLRRLDDHAATGRTAAHPARVPAPGTAPGAPAHTEPTDTATPGSAAEAVPGRPETDPSARVPCAGVPQHPATGEWHTAVTPGTSAQGGFSGPQAPGSGTSVPSQADQATAAPGAPAHGLTPSHPGAPHGQATDPYGTTPAHSRTTGPHRPTATPGASAHSPLPGHHGPAAAPGAPAAPGQASAFSHPATPSAPAPRAQSGAHPSADLSTHASTPARRPSWAKEDTEVGGGGGFPGPYTVVVVDGDPGGSALRDALARLAVAGPRAGIHVVSLAETEPASPASPVERTYEDACAVTPTFRHCGAVALLSGDVATALRLLRVAPGGPVGPGTLAAVDAVSAAWAERFARALAPLRPDGPVGERDTRLAAPLPQSARLLDELGLARATPASLMARWADAADDTQALGGRARAILGAGPRGPLTADLVADGPHLLIEGPAGSGRTELLRAVVASLAAAERPDRLGVVLIDGRDGVGAGAAGGEALRVCTDIPHVTTHLIANDPVRMREFAQSLAAELKRRAELLGRTDFAEWHAGREVSGRIVAQRSPGTGDIEVPPSSTLRLRPGAAARPRAEAAPPPPPRGGGVAGAPPPRPPPRPPPPPRVRVDAQRRVVGLQLAEV
ncbi:FHA domain-containing protein, partial [Streptomyces sp. NPDC001393]